METEPEISKYLGSALISVYDGVIWANLAWLVCVCVGGGMGRVYVWGGFWGAVVKAEACGTSTKPSLA